MNDEKSAAHKGNMEYVKALETLAEAAFQVLGGFAVSDGRGNELVSAQAMNALRKAAEAFRNTVTPT